MSELCMYELEDNVWDEFGATDDHIVPHSTSDYSNQFTLQSDSRKKPRHEVGGTWDAAKVTKYGMRTENKGYPVQVEDTMLEKNSWSHSPDGAFLNSGNNNSLEQAVNIVSDDQSHEQENGKTDCVASGFCAAVDNAYCYPLNHVGQAKDDLNFLIDGNEGKDGSELIYYNWPDIGNFEDFDRMFRSCDSTLGLESLSNEDELCWFSSSHVHEGSEDALNSNTEFNGLSEQYSACKADSTPPMSDEPNDIKSRRKDDLIPEGKISQHKLLFNQVGESEERKEHHIDNGGYFQQYGNIIDPEQPDGDSYCQAFSPSNLLDHKQKFDYDSSGHIQNYMHLSDGSHPEQISFGATVSGTTSENNGCPSSTKESSFGSNHVKSTESSLGPSFEGSNNDRKIPLQQQQGVQAPYGSIKNGEKSARKVVHQAEQDGYSEVKGGSNGVRPDIDSSRVQESSCMSSAYDEISREATSFRQLQQVMEKLDVRTKLCIRDSLYRLARSAEQRCISASGSFRDDKEENEVLMTEETNKCTVFMDIETDTNPIDRSIAHLLFHRPSDPSQVHSNSTLPLKSHPMSHGSSSNASPPAEKLVGHDDIGAGLEKMVSDSK